ncbi:MAG: Small-conductance mechanosensitive channel [Phormidium sp. OSCR]|nr:MAG: Small-conductance mechanosensitive channel [Phormidium sp. OSCR]
MSTEITEMLGQFSQQEFLGNQVLDYLIALAIIILGLIVIKIVANLVLGKIKKWLRQTDASLDNSLITIIERALIPIFYLGIFYVALNGLTLHPILDRLLDGIWAIAFTVIGIRFVVSVIQYGLILYGIKANNPNIQPTLNSLVPAIRVVVWAIGFIFLLDNLNFNVSAMIASLGIGGIAIALASQGLLQDLFSYFSIVFDRPFELGDFIIVGDFIGTVEYIGIKTTRLKSLSGERLVISNTDLTGSRIRNYKHMQTRRIVFKLGVTYETGVEQLEKIPQIIQDIIDPIETITFDRAHFLAYGDFSLDYEVVYNVNSSDFTQYMDAQQQINLELKRRFEAEGIEFAYPTQVIYHNSLQGG